MKAGCCPPDKEKSEQCHVSLHDYLGFPHAGNDPQAAQRVPP
jgi:hypothetical protein